MIIVGTLKTWRTSLRIQEQKGGNRKAAVSMSDSYRMQVFPPVNVKHISILVVDMQASTVLFEFHRPGKACAESQHGGEDNGGSMFLELQAFLQPLAVLGH